MEILDYYQEIQQHDLTEAKNDCRSSRGNSADGIHGAHQNYRVSTGEGPALAWNLRDRARAASDQRRRRAPLGKIPWHAAAVLDESSSRLRSAARSSQRAPEQDQAALGSVAPNQRLTLANLLALRCHHENDCRNLHQLSSV